MTIKENDSCSATTVYYFIFLLTFTFLGDPTQHRIKDQRQKIICQIADIVQLGASSSRLSSTNTAAILPPQQHHSHPNPLATL